MRRARSSRSSPAPEQLELLMPEPEAPPEPPAALAQPEPTPLDEQFARLMVRLEGRPHPALLAAARGASAWRTAGHTCVPLARLGLSHPELAGVQVIGGPGERKPLILDGAGRLYLHRYWAYEEELARSLARRLAAPPPALEETLLARDLQALYPAAEPDRAGDQRRAAERALRSRFTVITGGPGTGKTHTVAAILTLLARQSPDRPPRLLLAAPTGKAALRLAGSIQRALEGHRAHGLVPAPPPAQTLHRLLGVRPDAPLPRWNTTHPLPADAVIVDEASMIDLALMAKLFSAVPLQARLILLGDPFQLASVEAGRVLGDLCHGALGAHRVVLRENFRFGAGSGLHRLSQEVKEAVTGDPAKLWREAQAEGMAAPLPSPAALPEELAARVVPGLRPVLEAGTPEEALAALGRFGLLCAVREGPYGVRNLNRLTEAALARQGLIAPGPRFYRGRVIMVLRNDYSLHLFNGDLGLLWPEAGPGSPLRAFFAAEDGSVRSFPSGRLPEHETAWAMTVHKSQGSEWEKVLLVLPPVESPVLTRELVYTGLTRARRAVELWADPAVFAQAVTRETERFSGLAEKLGPAPADPPAPPAAPPTPAARPPRKQEEAGSGGTAARGTRRD